MIYKYLQTVIDMIHINRRLLSGLNFTENKMTSLLDNIQDSELELMPVLWKSNIPVVLIEIRRKLSVKCG